MLLYYCFSQCPAEDAGDPKFKIFFGGACLQTPPGLGCLWRNNYSSPMCAFEISCYAADYAHRWKKTLNLEGVGGGGVYFKNCYCQGGGGVGGYVFILGKVKF